MHYFGRFLRRDQGFLRNLLLRILAEGGPCAEYKSSDKKSGQELGSVHRETSVG